MRTFTVLLTIAAALTVAAPASARIVPAPIWQPVADTPAAVQHEATRVTAGLAGAATGAHVDAPAILGCWDHGGRLRWRCLVRFPFADTHCDIVEAIGLEPVHHIATGRITYGPRLTTQRARVVWGPCTSSS